MPTIDELEATYRKLPKSERIKLRDQIKKELAEIKKTQDAVYAAMPYLKFEPNPAQYRWLEMLQHGVDEKKMKFGIFPGNGTGKTFFTASLFQNIMCPAPERNPWFDLPFIRDWKWPKHLRLLCKADDLKDFSGQMWKVIHETFPLNDYETNKQDHGYVAVYRHKRTGFTMSIRTFDQDLDLHDDGSELGLVAANEPPPASIWQSYPPRLRAGGIMLAFCTLVRESRFFKDDVIDNPRAVYTFGESELNCKQHARLDVIHPLTKRPLVLHGNLDHDALENAILESPKWQQEARRTGKPVHLSGSVFDIVPEVHFIDRDQLPMADEVKCKLQVLDPHERRPWAMINSLVDIHGCHYIYNEWPRIDTQPWKCPYHKITTAKLGYDFYADLLRKNRESEGIRPINCVIDSKFAGKLITNEQTAQKLREILQYQYKLPFQSGHTVVRGDNGGIVALQNMLAYDQSNPVEYGNRPMLYVVRDCWNTCHQLENITWDEMADPDQYGMSETLDERLLDFVRLIMYAIMHRANRNATLPSKEERERGTLEEKWAKVSEEFGPPHDTESSFSEHQPVYV